jgi:hypothetical protein
MPNPRPADLTDDQYQTLVGLGLTDGAIKYLRPEAMAERLAAPQPTLTMPSAARTVPDPAVTTRGPEPSLRAQQDFVQSFLADPAKQQEAAEAMERVRSTQFATGEAEPRPGMSLLQSLAEPISSSDFPAVQVARGTLPPEEASKAARVAAAFLPQTTQTPQVRQQTDRYLTQARQAAVQQAEANLAAGRYQFDREDPRFAQEIKNRQRAIMVGEIPPTLQGAVLRPGEEVTAEGELVAQMAKGMESRLPTGSMIESPGMYMGRLFSIPTSLPSALRPDTTVEQAITEGRGFIGLTADAGSDIADDILDLDEDSYLRSAIIGTAGAIGLVGELLTPLDFGVTRALSAAGQTIKTARLAKAADLTYTPTDLLYRPRRNTLNERIIIAHADSTPVREGAERYQALLDSPIMPKPGAPNPRQVSRRDFDKQVRKTYKMEPEVALKKAQELGLLPQQIETVNQWRAMARNDASRRVATTFFSSDPTLEAAKRARLDALRERAGMRYLRQNTATSKLELGGLPKKVDKGLATVRLTDELVAPAATAATFLKEFQQTLLGRMSREIASNPGKYIEDGMLDVEGVYKAVREGMGTPTFAQVDLPSNSRVGRVLFDTSMDKFDPTVMRLPASYAVAVNTMGAHPGVAALNRGMLTSGNVPKQGARLRLQDWNEGMALQFRDLAATHPAVRAVGGERLARMFSSQTSTIGRGLTEIKKTKQQVRTVLLPKELRPSQIRKMVTFNEASPGGRLLAVVDDTDLYGVTPALQPAIREVGERWSSMDLDFMAKWRTAKKSGLSHQDAFAEVIIGIYDSPRAFVYDSLMNAYGGFESVASLMSLTSGPVIKSMLGSVPPSAVRRAVGEVLVAVERGAVTVKEGDELFELVEALRDAMRAGTKQDAMGRTARALELLDDAALKKLADNVDPQTPYKALVDEALQEYPEPKLFFRRDRAADLFSTSYAQREIENILSDVLTTERVLDTGGGKIDFSLPVATRMKTEGMEWASSSIKSLKAYTGDFITLTDDVAAEIMLRAYAQQIVLRPLLNKVPTVPQMQTLLPPGTNGVFNTPSSIAQFLPGADAQTLSRVWQTARQQASHISTFNITYTNPSGKMPPEFLRSVTETTQQVAQARMPTAVGLELTPIPVKEREFLLNRLNLPAFTETLETIQKQAARNPTQNRIMKFVNQIVDMPDGTITRTMKGGLLSGVLLPTFRYMGMNVWTAPGMIHQTIGTGAALQSVVRSIKDAVTVPVSYLLTPRILSSDALKVADTVYRGTNTGEVLFTTPQGVTYTRGAVADLMRRVQSQIGAELRGDMFASWKAYSETRAAGDFMAPRKGFMVTPKRAGFKMTGLGFEGGPSQSPSLWAEVADGTDYYFRAGVMIDALKAGRPPDEALALARDALLDYSKVSAFEKAKINKFLWFWSFRRENLRTSAIAMADNPQRFRAQYSIANNGFDYDDRYTEHTREYAENRPFAELVNDPVTRKRYASAGPALALLDGVAELLDFMSAGLFIIDTAAYVVAGTSVYGRGGAEVGANFGQRLSEGSYRIVEAMFDVAREELPPHLAIIAGYLAEATIQFGDVRSIGTYIDPRMLAYVNSVDDMQSIFGGLIAIEPIPPAEERAGGGRFNGRQWRVAPESKHAYNVLMAALLTVGLQRAARDYAPMFMELRGMEDVAGHQSAMDELLFQSGLSTPVTLPTTQERQIENERAIIRMLREQTRD